MGQVESKEIMGITHVQLLLLGRVSPYNTGELAWFPIDQANIMIRRGEARRAVSGDAEPPPADVMEANIPPPKVEECYTADDFREHLELVKESIGDKGAEKLLGFYGIDSDGRKRSQEETNFAVHVLALMVDLDGQIPGKPPAWPPWFDESMYGAYERKWSKLFR